MSSRPTWIVRLRAWSAPIVIVALCLPAIAPWAASSPPCADDLAFHLVRAIQLQDLLRQGVLYSRWAPNMALGFGYPLFNFYAPLAYYPVAALILAGISPPTALAVIFAVAHILAALAAYGLARNHFSPQGGLLAAVVVAYAPYLGYDAFFRGNLAETIAWPLIITALWAFGRLARRPTLHAIGGGALALAALVLTHNASALVAAPLVAAYGIAAAFTLNAPPRRWSAILATVAAYSLALIGTAFFWLPALAERAHVQIEGLSATPTLVYWNNLISLRELLAAPRAVYTDLVNPSPPRALGMIPVLLGLPALVGLRLFRERDRRFHIAFFSVALFAYAWLTTTTSRFVWDHLPLLAQVQFPWRLLCPAAICLAMLAAASADLIKEQRGSTIIVAAAIACLVAGDLIWLSPARCPEVETRTAADIPAFERATLAVGTTANREYLPRSVKALPEEEPTTLLDPAALPPGTSFIYQPRPIGADLILTATQPFTATYNGFDYPGWRVTVDGIEVPTTPDTPYGRITFPAPAGRHHVSIRLGETPLRMAADLASAVGAMLTLGLLVWPVRRSRVAMADTPVKPLSLVWAAWGLALLGFVLLIKHGDTPLCRRRLQAGALRDVDVRVEASFEGGLRLMGFDLDRATLPSGERLRIDLYWTAQDPAQKHDLRTVDLLDANRLLWSNREALRPGDFRQPPDPWNWPPDTWAMDSFYVEPVTGAPPGTYDLILTLFELERRVEMRVLQPDGQPGPPTLTLGQIVVTRPSRKLDPAALEIPNRLDAVLGPLTLLSFETDRAEAASGDPVRATFLWLAAEDPLEELTARLELVDSQGEPAAVFDLPPTSYPTTDWRAGDIWRGQHLLHTPASLADGDYGWRLTLLPGGQRVALPSILHIVAPSRLFAPPPFEHPVDIALGQIATLVGFDIHPQALSPGNALTVTLVWRAEGTPLESYRVFVHLLNQQGRITAQSDGIPAAWSRPTTGWLAGEYILDTHTLLIPEDTPPGEYILIAGLYDPQGQRLLSPSGKDTLHLITIPCERAGY